ncbi:hypothetical protein HDU67_002545, partial [Dinochytrium kinnereticum]
MNDDVVERSGSPLNFFDATIPKRGDPWILPPASSLPPLPKTGPGFGCFASANTSVGFPLFANATVDCAPGFFCPYYVKGDPSTIPVSCPASPTCQIVRLKSASCMPQGRYEPIPCMTGFYCPNPSTAIPCPTGYFCPRGSVAPRKCQILSSCPSGSSIEAHYGILLLVIAIDIILALLILVKRIQELKQSKQPVTALFPPFITNRLTKSRQTKAGEKTSPIDNETGGDKPQRIEIIELNGPSERDKMNEKVQKLVEGFRAAIGDDLRMNFSFKDLSLRLPSGVTVLKGVTGEIRAGRMTAIMGPSGAGKTTFMNVLMGKANRTGGELKINGVVTEMQKYKKIIGYVPQEDIMHRELTVRENILYSARIRLPSSWTEEMTTRHTENVIEALSLAHVKHSPIGDELTRGISGGQRKRVNVGMELAA